MSRYLVPKASWLPYLAVGFALAILWGPVLLADSLPAFRDVGHYYYPLYRLVHASWSAGEVPLWNPQEDTGRPLLADMTSAALYPGHLVFALPIPYPTAFLIFLVSHLAIAGLSVCYIAHRWRWSSAAACLAATTYACGGTVFGQYANPPFLIGAAWLPWLSYELERVVRVRRPAAALRAALPWTLILLGGDLQTAYHAGLLVVLFWFARLLGLARSAWRQAAQLAWHRVVPRGLASGQVLLASIGLTCGISAAQLLPSAEFAHLSDRVDATAPRNVYEWWNSPVRAGNSLASLWQRPEPGTHEAQVNRFSVGPWRWLELFCPLLYGQLYPTHTRWIAALPAEGPFWVPHLYLGLLPATLFWSSLRFLRGSPRRRWLSWMLVISLLAALGGYGPVWLINQAALGLNHTLAFEHADPGTGGLYWWLRVLLPSYANFRYPAKWWTFAQLAIALLAGQALHDLGQGRAFPFQSATNSPGPARQLRRARWTHTLDFGQPLLLVILATSLLLLCSTWWPVSLWLSVFGHVRPDSIWGPLDIDAALSSIRHHSLHVAIYVLLVRYVLARISVGAAEPCSPAAEVPVRNSLVSVLSSQRSGWSTHHRPWNLASGLALLVLGHVVELTYAQSQTILTVPQPAVADSLAQGIGNNTGNLTGTIVRPLRDGSRYSRYYRVARVQEYPQVWSKTSAADRTQQLVQRDIRTGYPKYHLLSSPAGLACVAGPVSVRPATFERWLRAADLLQATEYPLAPHQVHALEQLGVHTVVEPGDATAELHVLERAFPRAWIAAEDDVERADEGEHIRVKTPPMDIPVRWETDQAHRQVLRMTLDSRSWLIMSDLAYPGRIARVTTNGVEHTTSIHTANDIFRAIPLGVGEHIVRLEYRPESWRAGRGLTILSVIVWGLSAAWPRARSMVRRQKSRRAQSQRRVNALHRSATR